MDYELDKVDETVLALLYLTMFEDHGVTQARKSHDGDALDRLYLKGLIHDPKGKVKSVIVTEVGRKKAKGLFEKFFSRPA